MASKLNGPPASKKQKLDALTDSSDVGEIESDKETVALEAIDMIHTDIDRLNEKASEEIIEVEKKYKKLKQPHFDKRQEVIEQIPSFWTKTLLNHPQIFSVASEKEKDCLQYLKKVMVEDFEDMKSGYSLSFCFKANPYFSNEILCKEFHLDNRDDSNGKSKSTQIDWKDGMDLVKHANSLPRVYNKRRNLQCSFFTWFQDNKEPALDSIAESIKEDMWPNPLTYYLSSELSDGESMEESDEDDLDESVVVVEDDEDEDEEVYEVEDDDDEELDTTGDVEVIEEEDLIENRVDKKVEDIDNSKDEDEIGKTKDDKKTDKSKPSDKNDKSNASDKNDKSEEDDGKTGKSDKEKDGVSSKEKDNNGDEGKISKDVDDENKGTSSSGTNG